MICTYWGVIRNVTTSDVHDKAGEGLARAERGICSCPVAYLLATNGILLVSERQSGIRVRVVTHEGDDVPIEAQGIERIAGIDGE